MVLTVNHDIVEPVIENVPDEMYRLNKFGYKILYKPTHPNSDGYGYVLEHRYVMAEHLGRPLTKEEVVHP